MKRSVFSLVSISALCMSLFLVAFHYSPSTAAQSVQTPTPSADASPYKVVIPIENMKPEIPWLPLNKEKIPGVAYLIFNLKSPIFEKMESRRAFAASIDKQVILDLAKRFHQEGPQIATSLTPPNVLGVDLTNQIGIKYNPAEAKQMLEKAEISPDIAKSKVRILAWVTGKWAGYRYQMAEKIAGMWKDTLAVDSEIRSSDDPFPDLDKGNWDIFIMVWGADVVDPENFLVELFVTDRYFNFGKFSSEEYEDILVSAGDFVDYPPERQRIYIEAEKKLCEDLIPMIPLYFVENYRQ